MFSFSEERIVQRLRSLPSIESKIFAVLCARRLLPGYSIYRTRALGEGACDLTRLLDDACRHIEEAYLTESTIADIIPVLDTLIGDIESADWRVDQAAAEDAVAAVYYAYRCLQNENAQEAAWSAARAYSAVDSYVCDLDDTDVSDAEKVIAHPIVQQELARQERDLLDLAKGHLNFEKLLSRAKDESIDFLPWYNSADEA